MRVLKLIAFGRWRRRPGLLTANDGALSIEYSLTAALIAGAIVIGGMNLSMSLNAVFQEISEAMTPGPPMLQAPPCPSC